MYKIKSNCYTSSTVDFQPFRQNPYFVPTIILCLTIGTNIASIAIVPWFMPKDFVRHRFVAKLYYTHGNVFTRRNLRIIISPRRSNVAGNPLARTLELSQTIRSIDFIEKVKNRLYCLSRL